MMPGSLLIIGGTRQMGYGTALAALAAGAHVTVLNRGVTPEDLPDAIERLRADRTQPAQMRAALHGRSFDAVVDFVLFNGDDARHSIELLQGRTGHYIMISSGQVYLIRQGLARPFREEDYDGSLTPHPPAGSYDEAEWAYGMGKREAEDALRAASAAGAFGVTVLRPPMVLGERDPQGRVAAYLARLLDGGPILAPHQPDLPLRHVDADDVVRAVMAVLQAGPTAACNISGEDTVSLDGFLDLLGQALGVSPRLVRRPAAELRAAGLLPTCSPFSEAWMSMLDNRRSREVLGLAYTPLADTIARIVRYHADHPAPAPPGYHRRDAEIRLAQGDPS
jgi:nucleoside-diphosphate-sugar epimerase